MTSPAANDFRQFSEGIARDFLQTIMVVDDRAFFEKQESIIIPTEVQSPGPPRFIEGQELTEEPVNDSTPKDATPSPDHISEDDEGIDEASSDKAHELDAKKLIGDFAIKGIVCAVIRPKDVEVETLEEKVLPLAESCDIVVFDWVLYGATDGKKVKELISEITKRSSGKERRLRLIVVYTGQEELAEITAQIKAALEAAGQANVAANKDYTLETGSVRIAVYAKGHVPVAPENVDLAARVIPIEQLPDQLIREFTDMTMGLVSNVAIGSMAALRSNTHKLLTKFHPGMDAPFLAHRAMLKQTGDAGDLLVYLIGAELTAILDGAEVSRIADDLDGKDLLRFWLDMRESDGYEFDQRFLPEIPGATAEDVLDILRKGVESKDLRPNLTVFKKDPHKKRLTSRFAAPSEAPLDLEYKFAILTSIKSDYRESSPALLTGTLLKEKRQNGEKDSYWVCIQPICNCVRLAARTSFPLLPLKVVEGENKFDMVLPDGNNSYLRVKVDYNSTRLKMKRFDPSKNGFQMVKAHHEGGRYYFRASRGERYEWIAELKFEHAQRVLNLFAAVISRVGLDESEWLRRSS